MRKSVVRGLVAVGATISTLVVGATPASAVNVGTQAAPTGPPSTVPFTANGGAVRIWQNGTNPINCASTSVTGSVNSGSYTTLPATIGTAQLGFASCIGPLGFMVAFSCSPPAAIQLGSSTAPLPVSGLNCTITVPALGCTATLSGSMPGTYTNPVGATGGVIALNGLGGSLVTTSSGCPTVILNGTFTFSPYPVLGSASFFLAGSGFDHPFIS